MNKQEKIIVLLFSVFLFSEFIVFHDLPFFWDAISKSNRANWIYTHHFSSLIVPTEINSGHPPLWITGIALYWTVLGKAIWSARLLLLLVNFGVFYQIFLLAKNSFPKNASIYLVFIALLEPTLLGQTTMLNNDMLLLFFTLLGVNSLFNNKQWLYVVAIIGVLLTNLRGIYISLAFIIIHIWLCKSQLLVFNRKMLKTYAIGFVVFLGFMFYQYAEVGWFIISKNEGFSEHRKLTGLARMFKNSAAFVKNLLDFGRLAVWIPLTVLVYQFLKLKKFKENIQASRIVVSLVVFSIVFFIGFVPFSNPMGPRYLLISFILANILFINLLFSSSLKEKAKKWMVSLVVIAFISGHFWIYPSTIAQGWDSSLAYLNYFPQREKMLQYLKENDISNASIGTNLSLNARWKSTLNNDFKKEEKFKYLDLNSDEYILFSNIENKTKDEDIITLRTTWIEVKTFSQLGVFLTLYKNPNK